MTERTGPSEPFSPPNGAQGRLPFSDAEFAELSMRTPTIRGFDQEMSDVLNRVSGRAANERAREITVDMVAAEFFATQAEALARAGVQNIAELDSEIILHVHRQRAVAARTSGLPVAAHDLMALLRGASMHAHYAGRSEASVEDFVKALETTIASGHAEALSLQALSRAWPKLNKLDPLETLAAEIAEKVAAAYAADLDALRGAIGAMIAALSAVPTTRDLQEVQSGLTEKIQKVSADVAALDDRWSDPRGRKTSKPDKNAPRVVYSNGETH